jgi:hypothetical protein
MFTQWKGVEVVFKFINHRTMQYEAMRAFKRPMYVVASLEGVIFRVVWIGMAQPDLRMVAEVTHTDVSGWQFDAESLGIQISLASIP